MRSRIDQLNAQREEAVENNDFDRVARLNEQIRALEEGVGETGVVTLSAYRATVEDDQDVTVLAVSYTEAIRKITLHFEVEEDEIVGISRLDGEAIKV